jgi:hypothetical protein
MFYRFDNLKWDDFLKETLKKTEKLVKSIVHDGYASLILLKENKISVPRFLDEIADEIDVLENKKDSLFCNYNLLFYVYIL